MTPAPRHPAARRARIAAIAIVLTAGIGLAACGDDDGADNNDSPMPSTEMMDDSPMPSTEMMDDSPMPSTEMMDDSPMPSTEMMDDTTP